MSLSARTPTSGSQASGTSYTVPVPSGTGTGDTLLLFAVAIAGSIGPLTGFTDDGESVAGSFHSRGFSRVADGTEGSSFTITSAGVPGAAICLCYPGGYGGDPASPAPAFISSANSTSIAVPGVTLAGTGDWLAIFLAAMRSSNTTPGTITPPAGFTAQINTGAVVAGSASLYLMAADLETAQAAGATGTQTGTPTISAPRAGWLSGIRASAPPAGPPSGLLMSAQP